MRELISESMVRFHFIKCEYKIEDSLPVIYLIGRNVNTLEKKMFKVEGFRPYFYALIDEQIPQSDRILEVKSGFKSIFGKPLKQVITKLPSDVRDLRKYFSWTGEADIPFTRRFLIDLNIKTFFEAPDKDEIHYTEVIGE